MQHEMLAYELPQKQQKSVACVDAHLGGPSRSYRLHNISVTLLAEMHTWKKPTG